VLFFGEMKHRGVFRVGLVYLAGVWLLLQVADIIVPILAAPDWTLRALFFAAVLGFPLALILAWFYEVTPDGIRAASEVVVEPSYGSRGRKLDLAIIGMLVLAVGFLLVRPVSDDTIVLPNSVAILPLENLSPDPDDAYFAAGLHEEILNQLVKLRNLNVISRTSVLQYAENPPAIQEIAAALNVQSIMEGSVRYFEDRIRVTAQLIDPVSGAHLWSETYERDFDDIFAIESDIAMNIVNALAAELSLDERESIVKVPTDSKEAYALYLRSFTSDSALELVEQALALDENFALAHARRAWLSTYNIFMDSTPAEAAGVEDIVQQSAGRALEIDPRMGLAHAALATVHSTHWRGAMAEAEFRRAFDLTPSDALIALTYGRFKRYRGDFAGAVELLERAVVLSPNRYRAHGQLALAYLANKDYEEAARRFRILEDSDEGGRIGLASAEIGLGNYEEAVRELELLEGRDVDLPAPRLSQLALAYAAAGRSDHAERVFAEFKEAAGTNPVGDAVWARAYLAVGEDQLALESLKSAVIERAFTDQPTLSEFTANFWNIPQLNEPEFRELLDRLWD